MKRGLVLGGGGLVGMAYHAGAMKALDEFGVDVAGSDVIVGTSAGSIMGSYLASGWTPEDFHDYAHGRHERSPKGEDALRAEFDGIFTPLWNTRRERLQRGVGSLFALAASRGYWQRAGRGATPVARLRHSFPAGMYSTAETRARFYDDLSETWPREGLFVCAADLYSGERVAFGRKGSPKAPLPEAVLASTAIPGVFPPVRIGDRQYVDGGAFSATSLDLATEEGCNTILCVSPLGYRNEGELVLRDPALWAPVLTRSFFAKSLAREVRAARAEGVDVLVIRPCIKELKELGTNAMRHFDRRKVVEATRAAVLDLLESEADHPAVVAAMKTKKPRLRGTGSARH
jgi:NTE family protein